MGEAPNELTVSSGCSACGVGGPLGRVFTPPYVPHQVRTGRGFSMSETRVTRDRSWKKRVMGEKYDGR